MIEHTNEDAEARVEELNKKKWEIENEINLIKKGKKPSVFDKTEIQEQFYELNKMARELLADFSEVEQNFEQIRKDIQRQYTEKDITKGTLLVFALDALDEIEQKPQGKSFKAFWEFLMNDKRQQRA
jgi:predicted transcriptional regulator